MTNTKEAKTKLLTQTLDEERFFKISTNSINFVKRILFCVFFFVIYR